MTTTERVHDIDQAAHAETCPLCWFKREHEFGLDGFDVDTCQLNDFDDVPELVGGIVVLLDGFDADAAVNVSTGGNNFANVVVDVAWLVPWQQHEQTFLVRRCAERLKDAASFISAWRAGAWRTGGAGFDLRPNVAAYMTQFRAADSSEPF